MNSSTLHVAMLAAVAVPVLWYIGRRVGLGSSLVLAFAVAAFDVLAVPHFPHSPIACVLNNHPNSCTGHQVDWLMALTILAPLVVGLLFKETTGHKARQTR